MRGSFRESAVIVLALSVRGNWGVKMRLRQDLLGMYQSLMALRSLRGLELLMLNHLLV